MSIVQFRRAKLLQDAKLSGVAVPDIARALACMAGVKALSDYDAGLTGPYLKKHCSNWQLSAPTNVTAEIDNRGKDYICSRLRRLACYRWTAQRVAPLLSINSLMRPRTEPYNAQSQHREDSNIKQCINHVSLH